MIEKLENYSSSLDGIWWQRHPNKDDIVDKIHEIIDKINELETRLNENKITE